MNTFYDMDNVLASPLKSANRAYLPTKARRGIQGFAVKMSICFLGTLYLFILGA